MQRQPFVLEQLEGRALFSVVTPDDVVPVIATSTVQPIILAAASSATPLVGAFNVAGKYTHPLGNPDTGSPYLFTGTGKTSLLGTFTLTGQIRPPGFIQSARASGTFTLTNSKGTIRMSVKGPQQGAGVIPPFVSYTILRGTGAYANSTGKGTITIAASDTTRKFVFKFNQTS